MTEQSLLLTDLYELSMLEAYAAHGMAETAVFELFVRKLPPERGFLMAAGLEQVVEFLETMHFTADELAWLRASGAFTSGFVDSLAALRFTGDVDAMPEGTVFFPDEPVLRVTAPLPEAQLVETRLINLVHFQTVIASKAARMVLAAPGKQLVDFGLRRAHGAEAGLLAARASYLAGFSGTATVLAGRDFGIPIVGTMAHSFVQAHDDEATAFERFARVRPTTLTLLVDTYDTERGAAIVAALAPRLAADGITISAVRLDSGDLTAHARAVRAILDAAGLQSMRILASGGLDENSLLTMCEAGADAGQKQFSNPANDEKRPIDKVGEVQSHDVGRAMAYLGVSPSVIVSSPLTRAVQTATIVGQELGYEEKLILDVALRPEATSSNSRRC